MRVLLSAAGLGFALLVAASTGCGGGGGSSSSSTSTTIGPGGGTHGGGGIPVGGKPQITSVVPSSGAPGAVVTITGVNFASTTAGNAVKFGTTAAALQSASATAIVAVVPSAAVGSEPITVAVLLSTSAPAAFTVLAPTVGAPDLTGLSPAAGPVGTSVALQGTSLTAVIAVRFGAQVVSTTAGPKFVVPSSAPGIAPVVAVDGLGRASAPQDFLVTPVLTSVSPAHAMPGATITIFGNDLGSGPVDVRFGALATVAGARPGLPAGATSLTVTVPTVAVSLPASVSIVVAANPNTAQVALSNALSFTIDAPPVTVPTIATVVPSSGPVGTTVALTGSNFGTSPSVTVGGVAALVGGGSTSTSLSFAVPASLAAGNADVVVAAGGQSSAPATFDVTAPAASAHIVSIDPPGGIKGQLVVIRGAGFGTTAPTVEFAGATNATVVSFTDASVTVRVPDLGATAVLAGVQVKPSGGTAVGGVSFHYTPAAAPNTHYTFTSVGIGAMSTPRESHTATLLQNGKVLICGGDATGGANPLALTGLDTGEVFDPATGQFTAVANRMTFPRIAHTATLLPDGRVLIAGGFGIPAGSGGTEIYSATDIYDPSSNSFSAGPAMHAVRDSHVALPLADGDVLLCGGEGVLVSGGPVTPIATCERYTFAARQTSSFTAPPASMNLARVSAGAIPTFGGAFVAGGLATNGVELYSCEIYDQVANTWTKGTQGGAFFMNVGRVSPGVVRLASGGIAVIGGFAPLQGGVVGNYDAEETVESLSLTTGLFQLENYHMLNRVGHTVTVLPNDEIIAIGSAEDPYERLAVLLTSALGVLSDPQMAVGRFNHTATLLFDGRVLVTGGGGDAGGFGQGVLISPANIPVTASAEVYEP